MTIQLPTPSPDPQLVSNRFARFFCPFAMAEIRKQACCSFHSHCQTNPFQTRARDQASTTPCRQSGPHPEELEEGPEGESPRRTPPLLCKTATRGRRGLLAPPWRRRRCTRAADWTTGLVGSRGAGSRQGPTVREVQQKELKEKRKTNTKQNT